MKIKWQKRQTTAFPPMNILRRGIKNCYFLGVRLAKCESSILRKMGWQLPPQAPTPAVVASKILPKVVQPRSMAASISSSETALHKQINFLGLSLLTGAAMAGIQGVQKHL